MTRSLALLCLLYLLASLLYASSTQISTQSSYAREIVNPSSITKLTFVDGMDMDFALHANKPIYLQFQDFVPFAVDTYYTLFLKLNSGSAFVQILDARFGTPSQTLTVGTADMPMRLSRALTENVLVKVQVSGSVTRNVNVRMSNAPSVSTTTNVLMEYPLATHSFVDTGLLVKGSVHVIQFPITRGSTYLLELGNDNIASKVSVYMRANNLPDLGRRLYDASKTIILQSNSMTDDDSGTLYFLPNIASSTGTGYATIYAEDYVARATVGIHQLNFTKLSPTVEYVTLSPSEEKIFIVPTLPNKKYSIDASNEFSLKVKEAPRKWNRVSSIRSSVTFTAPRNAYFMALQVSATYCTMTSSCSASITQKQISDNSGGSGGLIGGLGGGLGGFVLISIILFVIVCVIGVVMSFVGLLRRGRRRGGFFAQFARGAGAGEIGLGTAAAVMVAAAASESSSRTPQANGAPTYAGTYTKKDGSSSSSSSSGDDPEKREIKRLKKLRKMRKKAAKLGMSEEEYMASQGLYAGGPQQQQWNVMPPQGGQGWHPPQQPQFAGPPVYNAGGAPVYNQNAFPVAPPPQYSQDPSFNGVPLYGAPPNAPSFAPPPQHVNAPIMNTWDLYANNGAQQYGNTKY